MASNTKFHDKWPTGLKVDYY